MANSDKEDNYKFFIFSNYISDENKRKIDELKSIRDFELEYFILDMLEFKNIKASNNIGDSAFYRLKAFEMLSVDKVIYFDSDIIIRKDIKEFYRTNISSYCCAGVEDLISTKTKNKLGFPSDMCYINSGVMLLNLNYCRQENILNKIKDILENNWTGEWNDQDLLNYIFYRKLKFVDYTWNYQPFPNQYKDKAHFNDVGKDPAVVHYLGVRKPWRAGIVTPYKIEYFKYLKITPWYKDFCDLYMIEESIINTERIEMILGILNSMVQYKR